MPDSTPPTIVRIRVAGQVDQARRFLAIHPLEAQSVRIADGSITMDLFIEVAQLEELESFGLKVVDSFDATARGGERQREVGIGNRFRDDRPPQGLGIKQR